MKAAKSEYEELAAKYSQLAQSADQQSDDHERMKAISLESVEIAQQLIQLSPTQTDRANWTFNTIEDLSVLCSTSLYADEAVKSKRYLAEIKSLFQNLKYPEEKFLIERYQETQKKIVFFDFLLSQRNNILYGTKGQDHFNQFSSHCVKEVAQKIHGYVQNQGDLKSEFINLLAFLGGERHQLAETTETKFAEHFGVPRFTNGDSGNHETTPLGGRYAEGESDIKGFLVSRLNAYKETGEKLKEVLFPPFTYRVRVLEHFEVKALVRNSMDGTLVSEFIDRHMPPQINGVIIAEIGMTIADKLHPLTTQVSSFRVEKPKGSTPTFQDFSERSLEDFKANSNVLLSHFCTPEAYRLLIADLASLFEKAILWDKCPPAELNHVCAEMHYKLAHLMYFRRGSAAISEWLIKAIYQYHGLRPVGFKSGVMVDLKALATPFMRAFIHNYVSYWEEDPALAMSTPDNELSEGGQILTNRQIGL
jgi:hypothetical protein